MPDVYSSSFSETDGSNSSASPNGAPENMAPAGVNDTIRAVMGALKRFVNQHIPKTTAGTSTAYTLSYTVAPAALVDGMTHLVVLHTASGASPTLNVNSLGAIPFYMWNGSAWAQVTTAATLPSGIVFKVAYNSSEGSYRIVSAAATGIGAAFLAVANAFTAACTFSATLTMSGAALNEAARVDVASGTPNIGAAASNYVRITGTTAITAFDTVASGVCRSVVFAGVLTLTHDGTALILPGGANITTAAGDTAIFRSEGSGNWRCIDYTKADGRAVVAANPAGSIVAWVNWAGGGTTINAQGNVASITRNGTGDYTVTFTSAIAANASFMPSVLHATFTGGIRLTTLSTTAVRVFSHDTAGSPLEFTTYSLTMVA
jgi:hypothetical protein